MMIALVVRPANLSVIDVDYTRSTGELPVSLSSHSMHHTDNEVTSCRQFGHLCLL